MPLRAYGPLFGQLHGSGPPGVVALHGWGRRGADFDRVLEGLDAIALDLPGFGASPAPDHPIGARSYADVTLDALAQVGSGPFTLIGHSFGGRVASVIAANRPELVRSLVLTGVPLIRLRTPGKPPLGFRLARFANRIGVFSDDRMERMRRSRGSADYRAATGVMRDVLVKVVNETYEDELGRIRCPVHLVWGDGDTEVPLAVAVRAREILEQSGTPVTLTVLPGVGHHTPLEAPGALRATLEGMP